jgi:putative ABC transport system permease protein
MLKNLLTGQLRYRPLNTVLHIGLIALGTAAMLLVSHILNAVGERATRDARNIDLIVGAKGSPVQLVMAGVYHADVAPGNVPVRDLDTLRKHPMVAEVIPISLGDSVSGFRLIGSTPAFIAHYGGGVREGALPATAMDAVIGAEVAQKTGLSVGMSVVSQHGVDSAGAGGGHEGHPLMVVGVLAPTGTVLDRLVVTSLEAVWMAHGLPTEATPNGADLREATLAIVRYRTPIAAASLPRSINATTTLQAASPALESARLLTIFGWVADLLRAFAAVVLGVAGLCVFVALTQRLSERRYDIAVMRSLGASRRMITQLVIIETLIVGAIGAVLGVALARVAAWAVARAMPANAAISFMPSPSTELIAVAAVLAFSFLCALWPALRAYRLEAGTVLAQGR